MSPEYIMLRSKGSSDHECRLLVGELVVLQLARCTVHAYPRSVTYEAQGAKCLWTIALTLVVGWRVMSFL
jgi:hypothetical protein